jgi:hypothetical protein
VLGASNGQWQQGLDRGDHDIRGETLAFPKHPDRASAHGWKKEGPDNWGVGCNGDDASHLLTARKEERSS